MEQADAIAIGAGVVGLAVARQLSLHDRGVLVLESPGLTASLAVASHVAEIASSIQ